MKTTTPLSGILRDILRQPGRGVIGLVDTLLRVCLEHGLQLDWQADHCRFRVVAGEWEELTGMALHKSAFRAILARVAALCNERVPNSVSPYGGQGKLSVGEDAELRVSFVNTPELQKLELMAPAAGSVETGQPMRNGQGPGNASSPG
jgi:hypothetical protein